MDVARFFVYALLGEDSEVSYYSQSGQRMQSSRSPGSGW